MTNDAGRDTKQDELIMREVEVESFLTNCRKENDEVLLLKTERNKERSNLVSLSEEVRGKKYLEEAELSERALHLSDRIPGDKSEEKAKIVKLEEEVVGLQNDLLEAEKRSHGSLSVANVIILQRHLNSIALSLETKIKRSEEISFLGLKLFERLLRLTHEREKAMRSLGIRERLRARIADLKRRETEKRHFSLSSGCESDGSGTEAFLKVRNKYLRELDALTQANSHLSSLLRNTKLSRDGDCDRASALAREAAFQSFSSPDKICENLRQRIAKSSEKRRILQRTLDELKKEGTVEVNSKLCDGIEGREKPLACQMELAKMHLQDVTDLP